MPRGKLPRDTAVASRQRFWSTLLRTRPLGSKVADQQGSIPRAPEGYFWSSVSHGKERGKLSPTVPMRKEVCPGGCPWFEVYVRLWIHLIVAPEDKGSLFTPGLGEAAPVPSRSTCDRLWTNTWRRHLQSKNKHATNKQTLFTSQRNSCVSIRCTAAAGDWMRTGASGSRQTLTGSGHTVAWVRKAGTRQWVNAPAEWLGQWLKPEWAPLGILSERGLLPGQVWAKLWISLLHCSGECVSILFLR